jgi:hypothetical protein
MSTLQRLLAIYVKNRESVILINYLVPNILQIMELNFFRNNCFTVNYFYLILFLI